MVKKVGQVASEAGRVRHMPKAPKIWKGHHDYISRLFRDLETV